MVWHPALPATSVAKFRLQVFFFNGHCEKKMCSSARSFCCHRALFKYFYRNIRHYWLKSCTINREHALNLQALYVESATVSQLTLHS